MEVRVHVANPNLLFIQSRGQGSEYGAVTAIHAADLAAKRATSIQERHERERLGSLTILADATCQQIGVPDGREEETRRDGRGREDAYLARRGPMRASATPASGAKSHPMARRPDDCARTS